MRKRRLLGIEFPVVEERRSSLEFNKSCWIASVEGLSKKSQDAIRLEKNFRFNYGKYVVDHVRLCCESTKQCLDISERALKHIHENIEFFRDEKGMKLHEAFESDCPKLKTGVVKGKQKKKRDFGVPFKGSVLRGENLMNQMKDWAEKGVCEDECVEMMQYTLDNHQSFDMKGKYFVLLGATSAMGPLEVLLGQGATVLALARPNPKKWAYMKRIAEHSCGTLMFPYSTSEKQPGADLITQTPEIYKWIESQIPKKSEIFIGNFTYGNGELYVKLSIACDFITQYLHNTRNRFIKLGFYGSPGTVHLITKEIQAVQELNYDRAPYWQKLLYFVSGISSRFVMAKNTRRPFENSENVKFPYHYGVGVAQGPNYLLAKRIQVWRSCLASSRDGISVSLNQAPPSRTYSVTQNWKFAAYLGGMQSFFPLEVFDRSTAKYIMGGLLLHDVFSSKLFFLNTHMAKHKINPQRIATYGAFHGGVWKCGFQAESIGLPCIAINYAKRMWFQLAFCLFCLGYFAGGLLFGMCVFFVVLIVAGYFKLSHFINDANRDRIKWKDM